uniref:R-spondin 3 n=1 Tax=Naja naja TaxID=35670 RepID=A0A8C6VHK0_NAJNA
MQLRLVSWFFITWNLMEYVGGQEHPSRVRRQGKMHRNMSQACQGGCATCSEYNGCMSCKPRLFFFLKRSHMKQTGMCFSSCPPGYFGQRSPERNECMKCKADCECLENCPDWLEPNNHTMECNDIVHCKINEWSQWSPCTKNGKACEILQLPSTKGKLCPHTNETRTCVVQKKNCQKGGKAIKYHFSLGNCYKRKQMFRIIPGLILKQSVPSRRQTVCMEGPLYTCSNFF